MRLCLLAYGDLGAVSGGNLYDRIVLSHLEAQGHRVEVVALEEPPYLSRPLAGLAPQSLRRLADLRSRHDAILIDELCHATFALAPLRRHAGGAAIVAIVHHLRSSEPRAGGRNRLVAMLEGRFLRRCDALVCNSRTTLGSVESLLGWSQASIVAPPGGDRLGSREPRPFDAGKETAAPLRILFVGNLIARKGLETVLRGLTLLPPAAAVLRVVGAGRLEPAYAAGVKRLARDLGVGERVDFLGPLTDEDLRRELQTSNVLAVPSAYEGFGIVYLEAMAFGVIPIAGTGGATAELIDDGRNGFLVSHRDPQALAEVLRSLSADPGRRHEISLRAFETFRRQPTWSDTAGRIAHFLAELTSTRDRAAPHA